MQEKHFLELPVNVAVRIRALQVIKFFAHRLQGSLEDIFILR